MIAPDSVGIVQGQDYRVPCSAEGWMLESGEYLPELVIRYETYGTLDKQRSNVVLVCAPLTADAHAAGYHSADDAKPGWWEALIGPGKALDTNRYCVICSNNLGGCKGTTGPSSLHPQTGKPYGSAFPNLTIGDMVRAQRALLDGLGVQRLQAVIGGSMGGFQSMKWALEYPDFVAKCIIIAATTGLNTQALGFEVVGRDAILSDPAYENGDYYEGPGPRMGLCNARKLAHITYLSPGSMEKKFSRSNPENFGYVKPEAFDPPRFQSGFPIEAYLDYQGEKFVNRFDANSYLHITWAMDQFDLEAEYGSLQQAFERVQSDVLNINLSSDWLFPPQESRRISLELLNQHKVITSVELDTPYGHDGFLVEMDELADVVKRFMQDGAAHLEGHEQSDSLFKDRDDFGLLENMVEPGARVLDLGCGDGRLIDALWRTRGITGVGIDRSIQSVLGCLDRSVPILQWDLDKGLAAIADHTFDYVILNRTLQEVLHPRILLREMLRVGRRGVISFPNFGYWKVRASLALHGRMPKSDNLPHEWFETPNIHLFTLQDFLDLCALEDIEVIQLHCLNRDGVGRFLGKLGLRNLGAEQVVALVGKKS